MVVLDLQLQLFTEKFNIYVSNLFLEVQFNEQHTNFTTTFKLQS